MPEVATMSAELGALDEDGPTIRFTRTYPHAVEDLWMAVSDNEHLLAWFPQRVVGDLLTPGTALRFDPTVEGAPPFEGEVLRVDPPHLLEFRWAADTIRLELVSEGEGCTLVLTDVIDDVGKAARDAAGWHTCLDFLDAALDHVTPTLTSSERWKEVHGDYVVEFGPRAATIGPPDFLTDYVSPEG
jgi:uncharacterized protein YndB with AHSA1/START domain